MVTNVPTIEEKVAFTAEIEECLQDQRVSLKCFNSCGGLLGFGFFCWVMTISCALDDDIKI